MAVENDSFESSDLIGFDPEPESGGGTAVAEAPAGSETPAGHEYDIRDSGQVYPDDKPAAVPPGSEKPQTVPAPTETPEDAGGLPGQSIAGAESPQLTRELIRRATAAGLDIDSMVEMGPKGVERWVARAEAQYPHTQPQAAAPTPAAPAAPAEYQVPEPFTRFSNPAQLGIIPNKAQLVADFVKDGIDEVHAARFADALVTHLTPVANHLAAITRFNANVHKWGWDTDKRIADHKSGLEGIQNTLTQREQAEATQQWDTAKTAFQNGLDAETKQFLADPLNEERLEQACTVLAQGYRATGKKFTLDALLKKGFGIEFPEKALGAARMAGQRDVTNRDSGALARSRAGGSRPPQKGDAAAIANWDEKVKALHSR